VGSQRDSQEWNDSQYKAILFQLLLWQNPEHRQAKPADKANWEISCFFIEIIKQLIDKKFERV